MSDDKKSEFQVKRRKVSSAQEPPAQLSTDLSPSKSTLTKERRAQRQHRRDHAPYLFCKKKLVKLGLLAGCHTYLKQARHIKQNDLFALLNENPDLREYATDIPLDKPPIEALYYLLQKIRLTSDEANRLMAQGPMAWICLRDIINLLSEDNIHSLATTKNMRALLIHIEHSQPIAHACRLLSSHNCLNQSTFDCILQADDDAPNVAVCYNILKQQLTDIPTPNASLPISSLSTKKSSEAKETQNEKNITSWLILFVALPGLATAYKAIWDANQLSQADKLYFINQSLKLGTNIKTISNTLKMFSSNALLDKPKIEKLFQIFIPTKSSPIFIPNTLSVEIIPAKAKIEELPPLKNKLAEAKYISPNFTAAYRLGKILTSMVIAGAFDEEIWRSLFQKISYLPIIMTDGVRYLADQPAGKYKPGCRRVLKKSTITQMLELLATPGALSPQQLDEDILKIVSTAMGNQSPLPNLSAKHYLHLHLQVMKSSAQNKRATSNVSSFFSSSTSLPPESSSKPSLHPSPSSPSLSTLGANPRPKTFTVKNEKPPTATSLLDQQLTSIKALLNKALENPTADQWERIGTYSLELIEFSAPDYEPSEKDRQRLGEIEKDVQRLVAEQEGAAAALGYCS